MLILQAESYDSIEDANLGLLSLRRLEALSNAQPAHVDMADLTFAKEMRGELAVLMLSYYSYL